MRYLAEVEVSSLSLIKGVLNRSENSWRHHSNDFFACRKVIRISMRIPEDTLRHLCFPCCKIIWILNENTWRLRTLSLLLLVKDDWNVNEKEKIQYISVSSYLLVEDDSNVNENIWRSSISPFLYVGRWTEVEVSLLSLIKVVRMEVRIPEDSVAYPRFFGRR